MAAAKEKQQQHLLSPEVIALQLIMGGRCICCPAGRAGLGSWSIVALGAGSGNGKSQPAVKPPELTGTADRSPIFYDVIRIDGA